MKKKKKDVVVPRNPYATLAFRNAGAPASGLSLLNDGLCVTNHPSFMPLQKDVDKAQFCNYTASTLTKRSKYHDRNQPHPSRIE